MGKGMWSLEIWAMALYLASCALAMDPSARAYLFKIILNDVPICNHKLFEVSSVSLVLQRKSPYYPLLITSLDARVNYVRTTFPTRA